MSATSAAPRGSEGDVYVALRLRLDDFRAPPARLPTGITMGGRREDPATRQREQELLRASFRKWQAPWDGTLKGWRADSPIFCYDGERLVGGLYVTAANHLDDDPRWGEAHYGFVEPSLRGKGLFAALYQEAVRRARTWGLEGLIMVTNRAGWPEKYEEWGAKRFKEIPRKKPHAPAPPTWTDRVRNALRRLRPRRSR